MKDCYEPNPAAIWVVMILRNLRCTFDKMKKQLTKWKEA
jgi:hypothetical protein